MRDRTSKDYYLEDIAKYPVLSKKEMDQLFQRYKQGDTTAREKLINHNQRLIIKEANKYKTNDYMDLIQVGNLGLIYAIDNYQPDKAGLSTYMTICIRGYILKYFYNETEIIRRPQWQQENINRVIDVENYLRTKKGRKPTTEEIADFMNLTPEGVEKIINKQRIIPIDTPLRTDGSTLLDIIPDDAEDPKTPEKLKQAATTALELLNDEDREIMEYLYGLNGKEELSLEELGKMKNVSKQAIQQRRQRILNKLRYPDYLKQIRRQL